MKLSSFLILAGLFCLAIPAARAQDEEPAKQVQMTPDLPLSGARRQPSVSEPFYQGVLKPSVSVSNASTVGGQDDGSVTVLSGGMSYIRAIGRHELTVNLNGGVEFGGDRSPQYAYIPDVNIVQSFGTRRWMFTMGNTLSYLPDTPLLGGGGGIPGIGEYVASVPYGTLNPNLIPNDSILTTNSSRLSNSTFGEIRYDLSRQTSITTVISYGFLHYVDNSTLNNNQVVLTTGWNHQRRNDKISVQYGYTHYGYEALTYSMDSHSLQLMYSRAFGRNFRATVAVGPQTVPPQWPWLGHRVTPSGAASFVYAPKRNTYSLDYQRSVNGGSGLLTGAITDTVQATFSRKIHSLGLSFYGAYTCNDGVTQQAQTITRSTGVDVSYTITPTISAHISYSFRNQSAGQLCVAGTCAFDGAEHTIGAGLSWYPRGGIDLR